MRSDERRGSESDDEEGGENFFDAKSAEIDLDAPPAFPAINSAQRSSVSAAPTDAATKGYTVSGASISKTAGGSSTTQQKVSSLREALGVPTSNLNRPPAGGLMVPPSTSSKTAPPGVGGASGARLGGSGDSSMLGIPKETGGGARKKVMLQPGCSPLDWARLKSSGNPSLRAYVMGMLRVKPSELKQHNKPDDAWSAFNGKVYNITPYLRFHPGGEKELMRCAGRDGTRLFMLTHSWVNIDSMIDACMVGILVSENS